MTNGVTLSDCSGPKPMIQDWSCVGVSAQSVLIQVAISAVTNTDITGIIQISKGHCLLGTLLIPPIAWDIANEVLNRAHRMNKSRPCQHLPTASWSLGLACIHQQQINCLIVVRGSKDVVDIWPLGFHENGQHWFACGSSTSSLSSSVQSPLKAIASVVFSSSSSSSPTTPHVNGKSSTMTTTPKPVKKDIYRADCQVDDAGRSGQSTADAVKINN